MKGRVFVTTGYVGWGNRKAGVEAYGPGGRWAGPAELPNRANANVVYGDLLGDHLDENGCGEGSPIIVVASTSRFDGKLWAELAERLPEMVDEWVRQRSALDEHTALWNDEIVGPSGRGQ